MNPLPDPQVALRSEPACGGGGGPFPPQGGWRQFYPEDRILLSLAANPSRVEGGLDFDNADYEVDFGRYIDNELGLFVLPAEKELGGRI